MPLFQSTQCEYHEVAPVIGGDIINVAGPFVNWECEGNCAIDERLQIQFRRLTENTAYWISYGGVFVPPVGPGNVDPSPYKNSGEYMDAGPAQLEPGAVNTTESFYGTMAEFWQTFDQETACYFGPWPYGEGGAYTKIYYSCNTRTVSALPNKKQQIYALRWHQEWSFGGGGNFDVISASKWVVQVDATFPMGRM
jgi:hypothetical protein